MSNSFSLQEVPGKRPLTTVSHLAAVLLCTMHSKPKTSVSAVGYVTGKSEEFVPNTVKNQDKAGARCTLGALREGRDAGIWKRLCRKKIG